MKRLLFLLAVTAAAIAVPSTALAARGVALTKDQARHAVVVATKSGAVRTVRAPGRLGAVRGNVLRLAVSTGARVFVTVPAGFRLPDLRPGDEIELIVTVDAAGAFTLVSVQRDDEDDDDDEGIEDDNGRVRVEGHITAFPTGGITVQSEHGSPVTCAVPAGVDLSAFHVGDRVEMRCALVSTTLTLFRLKKEDDDDHGGDDWGHHGGGGISGD